MPFLSKVRDGRIDHLYIYINAKYKLKERTTALQTQFGLQKKILTYRAGFARKERASAFASVGKQEEEGSFTVEASLVMTFFLLSICGILYLFLIFHVQLTLQQAGEKIVQKAAQYGYIREKLSEGGSDSKMWREEGTEFLQWGLGLSWMRQEVLSEAGEDYLDRSCIQGGSGGIQMIESQILDEDQMIDLVLRYDVEIPVGFPGMTEFTFVQRCRRRAWVGGEEENTEMSKEGKGQVYVAETGTVYHLYQDCTHLQLSVCQVQTSQTETLRNNSGGKYKACEKCCADQPGTMVYVTEDGDRYHSTLGCSGLKRTVSSMAADEAEGMRICSRCRERKEKEQ